MEINDYLSPVSLDKPDENYFPDEYSFSRNINIHTPSNPVKNLHDYEIAILGVPEDRGAVIKGAQDAPDTIRDYLYRLKTHPRKLKIIDLGNLLSGNTYTDTLVGLSDVLSYLSEYNLTIILLGGTQDLTQCYLKSIEKKNKKINLVTIDNKLDFNLKANHINEQTYLNTFVKSDQLFQYCNFGHQLYFLDESQLDFLEKESFESYGLGQLKNNLSSTEPYLRDCTHISFDISAVRQSEAPAALSPSPNGFYGEEVCQITRYAGLSHNLKIFGVFNYIPAHDNYNHTAHLIAQMIWYLIDGVSYRTYESPDVNKDTFKQFIVRLNKLNDEIRFYKSLKTDKWWMLIPNKKNEKKQIYTSCSFEDYQLACNNEIPNKWWVLFTKLNS